MLASRLDVLARIATSSKNFHEDSSEFRWRSLKFGDVLIGTGFKAYHHGLE